MVFLSNLCRKTFFIIGTIIIIKSFNAYQSNSFLSLARLILRHWKTSIEIGGCYKLLCMSSLPASMINETDLIINS